MDIQLQFKKLTASFSLWVKEYKHALRVIAGFIFVLALLTGLLWVSGKDVEAITFVLGLLSSLLFSLPSIADYLLPSRKPIRHMDYDEILKFIETTNENEDWKLIKKAWAGEAFFKRRPTLTH